jgi:thymidine phosphorylase
LETEEAILLCSGCVEVAPDVAHLAVHQVAQLLVLAKHPAASGSGGEATDAELQRNMAVAAEAAAEALVDGRALPYFRRMVKAQGGDPGVVDEVALTQRPLAEQPDSKYTFAKSKHQDVFRAPHNGRIVRIDVSYENLET